MVGLLFPGQGSQSVGMGRDLADAYPGARSVFEEADDVLGFPLSRLCWEGPEEELTWTQNAQPAILTHSIAVHRTIASSLGEVDSAAGHSLGEFSAYVAAGALSFADALRVVRRRGELMYAQGKERPGAMAAIIGLDEDRVKAVCSRASAEGGECVPANFNAPGQVVISGEVPVVARALELAREEGAKRAIRLNVSGAFHSSLMYAAGPGLQATLANVSISEPEFPVISNVNSEPVSDPVTARRLMVSQLTSPVRWTDGIRAMLNRGVDRFLELGPGSVLTGLLKRIDREAEGVSVGTADQVKSLLEEP